jgi:rod shape-determining protein MreC
LVGVALTLLVMRDSETGSRAADDGVATGVRAGAGPAAATGGFFARVGAMWSAAERVEQLEAENQQLKEWRDTALALSERMERYEDLLRMPKESFGVGSQIEGAISARLILDPGGPFKRTLLANAGSLHGVELGYIAVNEHGLVGRVVAVGQRSSRVLMLDDFQSRVPVMGLQSRTRAILAGDSSSVPELEFGSITLREPRMDHRVPVDGLRRDERIVTSGDGGLFPRGLMVGDAVQTRDGGWRVRLAASSRPIDFIRLLPYAAIPTVDGEDDPNWRAPEAPAIAALPRNAAPVAQPIMTPPPQAPSPAVAFSDPADEAPPIPDGSDERPAAPPQ